MHTKHLLTAVSHRNTQMIKRFFISFYYALIEARQKQVDAIIARRRGYM